MIELRGERVLRVRVLAAAAFQNQLDLDLVAVPLLEVHDRRARPEIIAGVFAGDRIHGIRPQLPLPGRLRDSLADLLLHPDLIRADRNFQFKGGHARVLTDRPFAGRRLIDVLRDHGERLTGAGRADLPARAPGPWLSARPAADRSTSAR